MRPRFIYFLYRLAQAPALPIIALCVLVRCLRDRLYFQRLPERFGFLPHSFQGTAPRAIWLHAVSVGEVISSIRLLEKLRSEYPLAPLYVSSTTLAGRAIAEERLRGLADGIFYAPIDYCFAVRRVLRTIRPSLVIVLETEIWPNLYREAKRAGAGLLVINGRISDRAMPRYAAFAWFFRHVLAWPDAILAQSDVAAHRHLELGAPAARVRVAGNLKYDFEPGRSAPPEAVSRLIERLEPAAVWIAASTMPPAHSADVDEDDAVLEAFRLLARDHPGLLLLLVPRRPERFDVVAQKLQDRGIPFLRRSLLADTDTVPLPGVLLVDSIGELGSLFPLADVVFMGGTLALRGGHNILEPAFFSRPVIIGPHMENFPAIADSFRAGGGLLEIAGPAALPGAISLLLNDGALRERIGAQARLLALAERGATEKALDEVRHVRAHAVPCAYTPAPLCWLLWPLSRLWGLAVRARRARAMARRRSLETPVVSVGSITMGGAGKTPCVIHLGERLSAAGLRPAILTRGYRRKFPEMSTILEAGSEAPVSLTGDEAQLLLRSGVAPVGIGANRYETGRLLEGRFHPDVILLDDAFQHWRLERQLDIVLIDALYPYAGGEMFPLGWLREPLEALARADVFLITRAESGQRYDGIHARLRRYNSRAPVFHARLVPDRWIDALSQQHHEPAGLSCSRVAAFCGLGNPSSFWHSLALLGCHPAFRWAFGDHHHYRPGELRRLAAQAKNTGAEFLLTTEKDLMNLPPGATDLMAPLRLLWLKARMEIDGEAELLDIIRSRLHAPAGSKRRSASTR